MNNKESQTNQDAEKELAAKEEQNTHQDELSTQDAEIEAELQAETSDQLPEDANDEIREAAAAGSVVVPATAPKGGASKAWIAISAILAIALVIVLIKPPFGGSNETVATVNATKISKDRLYDALVLAGGPATLENLITEELIAQQAKAGNVNISDADVQAEIKMIKESFPSEEVFNQTIAQYGMTLDTLTKDTKVNLTIRKILEPKTDVTDAEIKEFYDTNKASLGTPEEVQASHILVATKEEAQAVLDQLKQGGDFAAIAKEKSIDPGSKDKGGDLGFFGKGAMVAEFEAAAWALKTDELSGIVQTENGFHVIKKTGFKEAVIPTLEEKKDFIRTQLVAQEAQGLSEAWMAEIRTKAKITNTLEKKDAAKDPAAPAAQ